MLSSPSVPFLFGTRMVMEPTPRTPFPIRSRNHGGHRPCVCRYTPIHRSIPPTAYCCARNLLPSAIFWPQKCVMPAFSVPKNCGNLANFGNVSAQRYLVPHGARVEHSTRSPLLPVAQFASLQYGAKCTDYSYWGCTNYTARAM